jgi:hypothetical protein
MSYFTFESSGLPATVEVASFRGEEAISSLYAFEVHLVVPDDDCASMGYAPPCGGNSPRAGWLANAVFASAKLEQSIFMGADLAGADLWKAELGPQALSKATTAAIGTGARKIR